MGVGTSLALALGPTDCSLRPPRPQDLKHPLGLLGQLAGDRDSAGPCPFKLMVVGEGCGEGWGRAWFLVLLPHTDESPLNQWEGRTQFPLPLST